MKEPSLSNKISTKSNSKELNPPWLTICMNQRAAMEKHVWGFLEVCINSNRHSYQSIGQCRDMGASVYISTGSTLGIRPVSGRFSPGALDVALLFRGTDSITKSMTRACHLTSGLGNRLCAVCFLSVNVAIVIICLMGW